MTCKTKNLLFRDGTNQDDRFLKALDPGSAKIHEFTLRDWMVFAWNYAAKVNFFNTHDDQQPDGNWQDFFKAEPELDVLIKEMESRSDHEPHLALFLCFLKLMQFPQNELNTFTSRHLRFYYEQVLKIKKEPAQPEHVHLIFELAKNAHAQLISTKTLLDGGKDHNGKVVEFSTDDEISVNAATVGAIKSICHNPTGYNGKTQQNDQPVYIRYATATNSSDGVGKAFKKEEPAVWDPFGNNLNPVAKAGFSLASPTLLLREGTRTIYVCFNIEPTSNGQKTQLLSDILKNKLQVFLTSEKGWISPGETTVGQNIVLEIQKEKTWDLVFTILLDSTQKAITGYDPKIHGGQYLTTKPIVKFLFDGLETGDYAMLQYLASNQVRKIQILADVKGVNTLRLANDTGTLDAANAFFPFTPIPNIGSTITIGADELSAKNWTSVSLNIKWKGFPVDLFEHYEDYYQDDLLKSLKPVPQRITGNEYFTANVEVNHGGYLQQIKTNPATQPEFHTGATVPLFPGKMESSNTISVFRKTTTPVAGAAQKFYETNILSSSGDIYEKRLMLPYLSGKGLGKEFSVTGFNPRNDIRLADKKSDTLSLLKDNAIRLTLNQDFLHQVFPAIYAMAMTKIISESAEDAKTKTALTTNDDITGELDKIPEFLMKKKGLVDNLLGADKYLGHDSIPEVIEERLLIRHIPNQPYTPVIQSISLDYVACEELDFSAVEKTPKTKLDDYSEGPVRFYHEHPFGQLPQHPFLKDQLFLNIPQKIMLSPVFPAEGELFIGLENATPLSIVNLLFQVSEGSENPLSATFRNDEKINWACLCNNEWKPLDHDFVLRDQTQNFLRSGIVTILLPEEMNAHHTFLEDGKYWLRASLPPGVHPDAVCRMIDIKAQAVRASCATSDIDTGNGFPAGAVTKLLSKPASIRAVSQPFHSFGGRPQEDDRDYFKRVSERLRHRNRAVTIWDYERLVLEKFPFIYKAKCLNHTSESSELAPGNVMMIVIPKSTGANSFDRLKPRVSQATLNDIENFLGSLCSRHITIKAKNPDYEPVRFEFSVKFKGLSDPVSSKARLNEELIRYISPWAANPETGLRFGMTIYQSEAIRFIESLDYVDFIKWFVMVHHDKPKDEIFSESSRGILVSEPTHTITPLTQENACND
jgi:hypothetical protein